MARRDGTGPMGEGPLTGRGMGPCTDGLSRRPYGRDTRGGRFAGSRRGPGVGFGRGIRRRDFSCRRGFAGYVNEPVNTMSEEEWLSEEKSMLEDRLNLINKELDNLSDE